ncbi:MAG: transcriptional regulator [Pseudomonadota bacterium]
MDKRALCVLVAERIRQLVARHPGGVSGLARACGLDRSALTALLSPGSTRLPRAEAVRRIAEGTGASSDWLLGLSHAEDAARELAPAMEIEAAESADGESPIARWHREAAGHKIRYVPAQLPEQLCLDDFAAVGQGIWTAATAGRERLSSLALGESDLEIAMPRQTLDDLVTGTGLWAGFGPVPRRAQLRHIAALTEAHYPALRLHLFDGRRTFAAPVTVFGPMRAALYLGTDYLVLSAAEDVRRLARLFDGLVRAAVVPADRVHLTLQDLAAGVTTRQ